MVETRVIPSRDHPQSRLIQLWRGFEGCVSPATLEAGPSSVAGCGR